MSHRRMECYALVANCPTEMGSVFNVVNLSVINNTVDGSDGKKASLDFLVTWLLPKVCRGLPLLVVCL
ncbi:hypothetical protein T05_13557 [Trichinella murrelli]|uniref:Uncharacterized protein n=1 Tax=Trichinella murrelli TaxID=144512 RepID=A0A0V0UFS9_9BILA|nr:hypothetical protein T05_13557 [Trichinella murrelli]